MKHKTEIRPGVGLGRDILIGSFKEDIERVIGKPELFFKDEDGDIIYQYPSMGIELLCFAKHEQYRLTIIEISSATKATLFGKNVFALIPNALIEMGRAEGYKFQRNAEFDTETGQVLYSSENSSLDLYYSLSNDLLSISIGAIYNENDNIIWPNNCRG